MIHGDKDNKALCGSNDKPGLPGQKITCPECLKLQHGKNNV